MDSSWVDLLGSGAVLKQTVKESSISDECPEFKQLVSVHLLGRTQVDQKEFQNTRSTNLPISCHVGEQILDLLPPGLMLCLRSMHVGEIARCKLQSRYALGASGKRFGLEPDLDLEYEVELLSVGDLQKEVAEQSRDELLVSIALFKARGNEFFKWNELERALRCYKEAVRHGDGLFQAQGEEEDDENHKESEPSPLLMQGYKDRIACISNIAAVLEKQGKLKEAMESCVLALQADPSHLKSLARATRIAVQQGSHEEAEAAINVALELAPSNEAVLALKRELDRKIAQHRALEKQRYGGFLKPVPPSAVEELRKRERENALLSVPQSPLSVTTTTNLDALEEDASLLHQQEEHVSSSLWSKSWWNLVVLLFPTWFAGFILLLVTVVV